MEEPPTEKPGSKDRSRSLEQLLAGALGGLVVNLASDRWGWTAVVVVAVPLALVWAYRAWERDPDGVRHAITRVEGSAFLVGAGGFIGYALAVIVDLIVAGGWGRLAGLVLLVSAAAFSMAMRLDRLGARVLVAALTMTLGLAGGAAVYATTGRIAPAAAVVTAGSAPVVAVVALAERQNGPIWRMALPALVLAVAMTWWAIGLPRSVVAPTIAFAVAIAAAALIPTRRVRTEADLVVCGLYFGAMAAEGAAEGVSGVDVVLALGAAGLVLSGVLGLISVRGQREADD